MLDHDFLLINQKEKKKSMWAWSCQITVTAEEELIQHCLSKNTSSTERYVEVYQV